MPDSATITSSQGRGVSLVDGDPNVRHARQLLLRSEDYEVRSYATCAGLLADPRSRDYPCIVLDLEMADVDGLDLLRRMRATGWHGTALLLDGVDQDSPVRREAERFGDKLVERNIGDQTLLNEIAASIAAGGEPGTPRAAA